MYYKAFVYITDFTASLSDQIVSWLSVTNSTWLIELEVTIARKVLPHPQGIKGSMHNLLNKGLFIWSHFARKRYEMDDFDVLKKVMVHDST
jgi:hypothetical protein